MEENQRAMEQMLKAQEGTAKEMFQDVYTAWNKHQMHLVKLCNQLLQHSGTKAPTREARNKCHGAGHSVACSKTP